MPVMSLLGKLGLPFRSNPCAECPLRRTSTRGWLGGSPAQKFLETLHSDAAIPCHMSPGFEAKDPSQMRHCTGTAIYRNNICKSVPDGDAKEACDALPVDRETIFDRPQEFLHHHTPPAVESTDDQPVPQGDVIERAEAAAFACR